ncbi:diguanylate cyclase/phosphodiesterase [Trichlorobacter thiogenes]|uniref:Diguanylate cyclase/phosphodiesterase n=1 Tax=Trichlorobacter thiogenes TaxID=115783 RepID=A0A1T4R150_9BACT|nr:EAL domain-containing protein [Trichlorobacter thiogenes]SKA09576.1 diguanylate cyclase/phosphodiesterase [Trichlorobacter thiogenes]
MKRTILTYLANTSIRRKLMLLIMLTCGLVLMATTLIFVVKEANDIISTQRKDLASLADILGKNVASSVTFNDPQSALDTMLSLTVKTDIIAAYVLKTDATIFSRYIASNVKPKDLPFEQLDRNSSPADYQKILDQIQLNSNPLFQLSERFSMVAPIQLDGQTIGTIVLFADMHELKSRLLSTILSAILVLSLAAGAAYLLSVRMQTIISLPILDLLNTMRLVSETKDFSLRADKPGSDEIGQLYDGFNEMLQEIEERNLVLRQRQEHLQELAHFDTLTRLPNRVLFHDRLQQAMNLALRSEQLIAVIFLDLDRFKDINDTLGHRTGDLLLQQVASRMELVLRDCDTVARLGGDEFTIFAQNIRSQHYACRMAQKLLDLFEIPYSLDGQQVFITCSIGITLFPDDGDTIDTLLMNADIAMYHAKADGKNAYRLYNKEMNQQASERVALQADLRKALDLHQLHLMYQPKFDAQTGGMIGVEALIRWQHPERGLIPPARFIPLAEESGAIQAITEWVLRTACKQAKIWYETSSFPISVAVNLSAYSLKRNNAPIMVQHALKETGLPAHLLELELTESMLIENDQHAEETLNDLKQLGITIAIDDFGTGYSSLSYLHRFPIDALKIDRSFVWNMNRSDSDLAIVVAIIAMAHSLKLKVVAEGVETKAQLAALQKSGCEIIQGYLLGRPTTAEDITIQLKRMAS